MASFQNHDLIMSIFHDSASDTKLMTGLENNPAAVFAHAGIDIPEDTYDAFNAHFAVTTGPALAAIKLEGAGALGAWPSLKCSACQIAAWAVAVIIAGLTGAAIASLSTGSAVVGSLATLTGFTKAACLAFIKGALPAIAAGIGAVCYHICEWIEACP